MAASVCATVRTAIIGFLIGLLPMMCMIARAAEQTASDADMICLGCHGTAGLAKDLGDGKTLSLHIPGDAFVRSVHNMIGCAGCHSDIDVAKHVQGEKKIKDAREYGIAMTAVCRQCHDESSKHYDASNHARLQRKGNLAAPVCTDCHGSHNVTPKTAYENCVRCHAGALGLHQKWLPNAALHMEVVSCAACHAPAVQRMVELRLYDGAAQQWVTEKEGLPKFMELARVFDKDGNGLDAAELRGLLNEINRDGKPNQKALRGRIELRAASEAHRLSDKSEALRACDNCHREGSEPFQNVAISMVGADGKPLRHVAHNDVLTSALSMESLRYFYAIGGTRNKLLDILLVLAVLGGISVPIVHRLMKIIVRRRAAQDASRQASTVEQNRSAPGDPPDGGATPK